MAAHGRHQSLRHLAVVAVVALFVAPAHGFFNPSTPISVPTYPGGSGGSTTGGSTGGGGGTGGTGGTTTTPETAPEPTSLLLALLGSGGVSLFAASRRRRREGAPRPAPVGLAMPQSTASRLGGLKP
jgi:hypothetical protein